MTVEAEQLRGELAALGVHPGAVVLVHCSLRSIGRHVAGGADGLRDVLRDLLGEPGTLVVPAQSRSKSTTSKEFRRAVARLSPSEFEHYVATVPGFDAKSTPSEGMGALAESVRTHPEAHRSAHPTASFAAVGRHAQALTASHPLDCVLGDRSPLGWMSQAGASVLLLGVGYDKCTAFHLGEDRSIAPDRSYRFKVGHSWLEVPDAHDYDDSDFTKLGAMFEAKHTNSVLRGKVGDATCRLFPLALAADFAAKQLPGLRVAA